MAITNCTVFDSSYTQSYSVIDYPRCPDDLVKADIPSGSDQERFTVHSSQGVIRVTGQALTGSRRLEPTGRPDNSDMCQTILACRRGVQNSTRDEF